MSEQQYNIIFRGDIVFGCQLGDVKLRLQQLFKTDEAKINALFSGRPVVVKRNLDLPGAEKYRAALLSAGAQVEIVAVDGAEVAVPVPPAAAPGPQPVADWSLAPVGDNLLKAVEQTQFVARTIDTGSLGLHPVGGNLVEAGEQSPLPQAKVVAPNLEVAAVGADLLRDDEKAAEPAPAIAVSDWQLSAVGADLLRDDEREIVLPALIAVPEVGLAPVGADLGQIKPPIKPVVPDISGIHLQD